MHGLIPWGVVAFLTLVLLILPFIYKRAKAAVFRRQGFVPLDQALRTGATTAKEFWRQAEDRGLKVRLRGRGEDVLVNAEDASRIIESIPRPIPQGQRLAEQIQTAALSAIAGAAAAKLVESRHSSDFSSSSRTEAEPEDRNEIIVARGQRWTVFQTGEDVFHVRNRERRERLYRVECDPCGLASPLQLYTELLNIPQFQNPHALIECRHFYEWWRTACGLSPEVAEWVAGEGSRLTDPGTAPRGAVGGRNGPAVIADSLQWAIHSSIPYRTHDACCWSVALSCCDDRAWSYATLGRALRILSNERENPVWLGVPLLQCDFSYQSRPGRPPGVSRIDR